MPDPIPYLDIDGRCAYLVDRGYAQNGHVSDQVRQFLETTNFHYFLGYARNFRKLVSGGHVNGDCTLDRVVQIVGLDKRLSTTLFAAIKDVEWSLRAELVEAHCALYPATACFLDEGHFIATSIDGRPTSEVVREQSLRIREPYVLEQYEASGQTESTLRTIPIWALVDGWSFGLLVRVIMGARTVDPENPAGLVWKRVAGKFGVSNPIFDTQLTSLVVLRNQVAHHSRLWMRPTSSTPKTPKIYARKGRDAQAKSMYVAALALASFLRRQGDDSSFLDSVDALLAEDSLFKSGIARPLD